MPQISDLRYRVESWAAGLNYAVPALQLSDNEIRDGKNIEVGLRGSVRASRGRDIYEDANSDFLASGRRTPIKDIFRYVKAGGQRAFVVMDEQGYLYSDENTRDFSEIDRISPNEDGHVYFQQWRDILYYSTRADGLKSYNMDADTEVQSSTTGIGFQGIETRFTTTEFFADKSANETNGNLDSTKEYYYRFTLEHYHGDVFLGESMPAYVLGDVGFVALYLQAGRPLSGDNVIKLLFPDLSPGFIQSALLPSSVRYINIYRSNPVDAEISRTLEDINFFFLGQVTAEDYNAASNLDVLFIDDGSVLPDTSKRIFYNRAIEVPHAKFVRSHKNRMWFGRVFSGTLGNPSIPDPKNVFLEDAPFRVYFSEYLEPETVRLTSFVDIGPEDGEPITQMASFENRALYIWKPNSVWAIFGGDQESIDAFGRTTGVIDIEVVKIADVGCIAPLSLTFGENAYMFASNRGPYMLRGTQTSPLAAEFVLDELATIPAGRKEQMAGIYLIDSRRYRLSYTDPSLTSNENEATLIYDFKIGGWSRQEHNGINAYAQAARIDEAPIFYAATNNSGLLQVTNGGVYEMEQVQYDEILTDAVDWQWDTKPYDCGDPDMIKQFIAIIVRSKTVEAITLDWNVDETGLSGSSQTVSPGGDHTWDEANLNWQEDSDTSTNETPTHVWGSIVEADRVVRLPQDIIGRRISVRLSGSALVMQSEVTALTFVYKPLRRVTND